MGVERVGSKGQKGCPCLKTMCAGLTGCALQPSRSCCLKVCLTTVGRLYFLLVLLLLHRNLSRGHLCASSLRKPVLGK